MGTANKQIATRANVNSKRLGAFVTSTNGGTYMKKCVTKKAVTDIQYLQVNNRETTMNCWPTNVNSYLGNSSPTISMNIQQATSYNSYINSGNITIDNTYHGVYCLMRAYLQSSSTYASLTYSANWPIGEYAKYYALYKRTLTVPTNQLLTLNVACSIYGAISDALTGVGGTQEFYPVNVTWYPGVIITNSDDSDVIANLSPSYCTSNTINEDVVFSSPYSTINVYFLISSINMRFSPAYEESYAGFYVQCDLNLKYYDSYYDQTYKLAQYQDIATTGGTFSCSYYIYNNKSSNAKLDWVKCYVGATSDPTKGTWTEVGSTTQGTVDSTASGTVLCTIPSSKISSTQQWFHARCAYTSLNQNWYGGWGTGGANYNATTSCGKQTWGYTPAVPLTSPTGASVLNYNLIRYPDGASMGYIFKGIYGQTSTRVALFRIE